jgi:hypothetical protein
MDAQQSLSSEERDLMLREAQWIQEDAQDAWQYIRRLDVAYLLAMYGVIAWIVGKALENTLTPENADPTLWAFRNRPDIGLAVSALPIVNSAFAILQLDAAVQWLAFTLQLGLLGIDLMPNLTTKSEPRWTWRTKAERMLTVRVWRRVVTTYLAVIANVVIVGMLWFVWPAAQRSTIVRAAWLVGVAAHVVAFVATTAYRLTIYRTLRRDVGLKAE